MYAGSFKTRRMATQIAKAIAETRQRVAYWIKQPWWLHEVERERARLQAEREAQRIQAALVGAAVEKAEILARIDLALDNPEPRPPKSAKVVVTDADQISPWAWRFCECTGPKRHMFVWDGRATFLRRQRSGRQNEKN